MTPSPRQEAAQQRIAELLAELAHIIGPDDTDDPDDVAVAGKPTLWDFVVVASWVDDERQDWLTVTPAAGMLTHHTAGLLHAGLDVVGVEALGHGGRT